MNETKKTLKTVLKKIFSSTLQRYNATRFAEIHDSVNDVVGAVCQHQCITHAVMIRQMQLGKKRGDAARTQLDMQTAITNVHHSTLDDLSE